MTRVVTLVIALFLSSFVPASAQSRVDPRHTGYRMIAIVPIIGKGTFEDPRRPMYIAGAGEISASSRKGILAYSFVESDDSKSALVEFVAADPIAFKDILADNTIKASMKGRDTLDDLVVEFKRLRKDFDLNKFGVRMQ